MCIYAESSSMYVVTEYLVGVVMIVITSGSGSVVGVWV